MLRRACRMVVLMGLVGLSGLLVSLPHASAQVWFEAYKGLPDYEKDRPFTGGDKATHQELREALLAAAAGARECESGSVPVPDLDPFVLGTNICNQSDFARIKALVGKLAPKLTRSRLTFWKVDMNDDGEPDLLVGYVDISKDEYFQYAYLSLWLLRYDRDRYDAVYAGPFLGGGLHAIRSFGPSAQRKMVFVKHQSCIECCPWVYLTVIDFFAGPHGAVFEFTYSAGHSEFGRTIEYELPGRGHSIDAKVESRIPRAAGAQGPHLLQWFDVEEGTDEWWVFTCKGLKCDYRIYEKRLPHKYLDVWNKADKL